MTSRERFEEWACKHHGPNTPTDLRDRRGEYAAGWLEKDWTAWQASRRAALEDALRAVQRAGLDYPCVEREPAEAAYDAIRALMEGE